MASSPEQHDPHSSEHEGQLARFTLHSRTEILFLLRAIQKRKLLVNLDLPGSRQIIVTSVLKVNESSNTLILDSARGDALNHELLSGKGAEFVTQLDGVSITFATGPVTLCEYEKLPALRIALPRAIIRLQRREHFRVPMPIANPVRCIVPALSTEDNEPISAHIVDIGCGVTNRSPRTSWISAAAAWRWPTPADASAMQPAASCPIASCCCPRRKRS